MSLTLTWTLSNAGPVHLITSTSSLVPHNSSDREVTVAILIGSLEFYKFKWVHKATLGMWP